MIHTQGSPGSFTCCLPLFRSVAFRDTGSLTFQIVLLIVLSGLISSHAETKVSLSFYSAMVFYASSGRYQGYQVGENMAHQHLSLLSSEV